MSASAATAGLSDRAPKQPYAFNPANARSERGKAHAAALEQQAMQPLMPVPLLQRKGLLVGLAVLCALFAFALHVLQIGNVLLTLRPHHFEQCRVLPGPVGSEDVDLDSRGVAFISADSREWCPQPGRDGLTTAAEVPVRMARMTFEEQGALWAYDARDASASDTAGQLLKLEIEGLPAAITDMHPHGISIPERPSDAGDDHPTWLYVINHQREGNTILLLEVSYTAAAASAVDDDAPSGTAASSSPPKDVWPPRLLFRGFLRHPTHLPVINDVQALYPLRQADGSWLHTVFVSNFMGSHLGDALWSIVETMTTRKWGSVALCQARSPAAAVAEGSAKGEALPTQCTFALQNVATPNGLALSNDKRHLYVACTSTQELLVFDLPEASSGTDAAGASGHAVAPNPSLPSSWRHGSLRLLPLTPTHTLPLRSGLDNLDLDVRSGDLLIGSHVKPLQVAAHLADPASRAPTQVMRLHRRSEEEKAQAKDDDSSERRARPYERVLGGGDFVVREIHLSDGSVFSGSSVGVWARGSKQLIQGGVAQDGIFICPYDGQ